MSTKSRRSADADAARQEDAARAVEDWLKLDAPSLRLKCNGYNVTSTGRKDVLATRLYEHFHELLSSTPPPQSEEEADSDGLPAPPDDILDIHVDGIDELDFHESGGEDDPVPTDSEDDGTRSKATVNAREKPSSHSSTENEDGGDNDNIVPSSNQNGGGTKSTDNARSGRASTLATTTTTKNKDGGKKPRKSDASARSRNPKRGKSVTPPRRPRTKHQNKSSTKTSDQKIDLILHQTKATHSEIKNVRDKQTALEQYVDKQIRALQQQVSSRNDKKRPSDTAHNNQPPPKRPHKKTSVAASAHASPTAQTPSSNATTNAQVPITSTSQQNVPNSVDTNLQNSSNIGMVLTTTTPNPDPWAYFQNPFLPPSLKDAHLKKIEEQQFVDLQDLHPENQSSEIAHPSEGAYITVDKDSGLLQQKDRSSKKVKINSFHRWVTCWNTFAQAHLHYHPSDFYKTFTYFTHMVTRFSQYKFEACLRYDREFRLLIANQRNLAPERRTVCWTRTSEEVRIRCLTGHELSMCAYCKAYGHLESNCRTKQEREGKSITQQIAAAFQYSQPQPRNQTFLANRTGNTHNSNNTTQHQQQVYAPNKFRTLATKSNPQPQPSKPGHKFCRYFNRNNPCLRTPCQFLHACSSCGRSDHNLTTCDSVTSSNFTPTH